MIMRTHRLRVWAGLLIALLVLTACGAPHTFGGNELTQRLPAPPFQLTDQHGEPFSLDAQRGSVVLMAFGYTRCPDICPMTLGTFKSVHQQLGQSQDQVRFVFITVDPARDTQTVMREHLGRVDAAIIGLTGSQAEVEQVARAYGVYHAHDPAGAASGHDMAHTERIFVIDRAGIWRLLYSVTVEPSVLTADIHALLAE